jgi:hypothetical protein
MKPNSADRNPETSKLIVIAGMVFVGRTLAILFGGFMAARYIGSPNWPNPNAPYFCLPLGILLVMAAVRMSSGNWKGLSAALFILIAGASVAYLGIAARYALYGYSIQWYPAGIFAVISGAIVISILLAKYRTKLFALTRKRS